MANCTMLTLTAEGQRVFQNLMDTVEQGRAAAPTPAPAKPQGESFVFNRLGRRRPTFR